MTTLTDDNDRYLDPEGASFEAARRAVLEAFWDRLLIDSGDMCAMAAFVAASYGAGTQHDTTAHFRVMLNAGKRTEARLEAIRALASQSMWGPKGSEEYETAQRRLAERGEP